MWWKIGVLANLVIASAYLASAWALIKPLIQTKQVKANVPGTATAAAVCNQRV